MKRQAAARRSFRPRAAAGLCGVCMYYLLDHIFLKQDEKFRANFFIGYLIAMAGLLLSEAKISNK